MQQPILCNKITQKSHHPRRSSTPKPCSHLLENADPTFRHRFPRRHACRVRASGAQSQKEEAHRFTPGTKQLRCGAAASAEKPRGAADHRIEDRHRKPQAAHTARTACGPAPARRLFRPPAGTDQRQLAADVHGERPAAGVRSILIACARVLRESRGKANFPGPIASRFQSCARSR